MTPTTEFSHIVTIEPWPADGIVVDLAATGVECNLLKKRFDLVDLTSLRAFGKIEKAGDEFVLDGVIEADVVQSCVATLKPVASTMKTPFERRYRRSDDIMPATVRHGAVDDEEALDIDSLTEDHIDVGEVIAEEFYLALDPYPRAGDADLIMAELQGREGPDGEVVSDNPFAKLRRH